MTYCDARTLIPQKVTEVRNNVALIVEKPSWCEANRSEEHACVYERVEHPVVHTCRCGWEWSDG